MRLRLEQRDRIEQRLKAMLVVPRPIIGDAEERVLSERIALLERKLTAGGAAVPATSGTHRAFAGGAALEHLHGI